MEKPGGHVIVVDCKFAPREDEKHTFRIGIKKSYLSCLKIIRHQNYETTTRRAEVKPGLRRALWNCLMKIVDCERWRNRGARRHGLGIPVADFALEDNGCILQQFLGQKGEEVELEHWCMPYSAS